MTTRAWGLFCLAISLLVGVSVTAASAEGRKVVLVSSIRTDSAVAGRLPATYSAEALRRELEVALESTGLFTVPTRDHGDLDPVLDELARSGRRPSKGSLRDAELILNPILEGFSLAERRRRAPNMRGKDSISVNGDISLTVVVLEISTGRVQTRMPVDLHYHSAERLADPLANDPLVRSDAYNGPPTPEESKVAYQAFGRAFAKRVLDQVYPALVAMHTGDQIYITRGEDSGYEIGEVLRIMRRGAEVRDPVTNEVLDRSDTQIGEAKIVEVRPRVSIAQITSSTTEIVIGDIVREQVSDDR